MTGKDDRLTDILSNLESVTRRVETAARKVNRDPQQVKIVVVTKGQPLEVVRLAVEAGAADLGENYPEQAVQKIESLAACTHLHWHMIGHLQSRKSDLVVRHFDYMHSLDSLSLAVRLDRLLALHDKKLPVLIEFNVGGKESKHGWNVSHPSEWMSLLPDIDALRQLPYLEVRGLMTMPPYFEDPEKTRPFYVQMNRLRDFLANHFPSLEWKELSMGTSFDFEVAVEEGASFIRLGQAILGPRPQK